MSPSQFFRRSKCLPPSPIFPVLLFVLALALIILSASRGTEAAANAPQTSASTSSAPTTGEVTQPPAKPVNAVAANVITWRAQDNPRVIDGTYVIPADTKVVMEPGVVVQINSDSVIQVDGELAGQGTASGRIQINSVGGYSGKIRVTGTLNLSYADVSALIVTDTGEATLLFADSVFKGNGGFFAPLAYNFQTPAYTQFDRCRFEGANAALTLDHATAVLRDVSFTGGSYARIFYSYVYLDRITLDGSQGDALTLVTDGPIFLDNVSATNAAGYGLALGRGYRPTNYFLGSNVKLQGNNYPVNLDGAGLLPGSTLPLQGNINNGIRAFAGGRGTFWANLALPYHLIGNPTAYLDGTTIEPGTTIKVGGQTTISAGGSGIRGTADKPIVFQRLDPAQGWFAIGFQDLGSIVEHTIIEGASTGVQTANNSHSYAYLNDVILRNNEMGTGGAVMVIGSQYLNNKVGHGSTGGLTAMQGVLTGDPASPNSFVGNGTAISNTQRDPIPAQNNWWNSPTGPRTGTNPNGTGEVVNGGDVIPFITSAPDYASDRPPVIRFHQPNHTYAPGSKVTLSWESSDDKAVVAHRVMFSKDGPGSYELLAELPGDQRAYEWTVPNIGFQGNGLNSYLRIVAVDSAGHERFDDKEIIIPSGDFTGTLTFATNVAGRTFKAGETLQLDYTVSDSLRYTVRSTHLLLDGEGRVEDGRVITSTDTARLAVMVSENGNRELWFYSPYFKIRPDSRLGDQPPVVTLTGPQANASIKAGETIPVSWTASDDEAVRSFNLQISYDGGMTWTMIARDLPATTTSYNVRTAPGTGYADVRLRVIAFDRRFQNSSDGANRSISIASSGVPNARPTVRLTSPGTESQFSAGIPVLITAEASDSDGTISRVDFYAGNTLIGSSQTAPYTFTWNNAPAGTHSLTAVAADNTGASTKSSASNLIINSEPPLPGTTAGALWAAGYNGPSNRTDSASNMALDAQGNVYLTGESIGTGTDIDIATAKYDAQGRQLWAVRYSQPGPGHDFAYDIGVDAQGNVYVTGQTWREFNFNGGTEQDIVTLKYSPQGALLWTRYYTGTQSVSSQDTPSEMEVDAAGNVYIAGMTYRTNSRGYLFGMSVVIKYDTNGNQVWANTYDSPGENGSMAKQLTIDPSGHIYVTGTVNGAVVSTDTTDSDIFTTKYDTAGNIIWRVLYDTPNNGSDFDNVGDVKVDGQGNVYLCGINRTDALTFKYNPDGTLAWLRKLDVSYTEGVSELAVDAAGNVFVVGSAEFRHNSGLANDDAVTFKYDASGNHLWTRTYTGISDGYYTDDGAAKVLVDSAGNAYVGIETRDEAGKYVFGLLKYTPDGTESIRTFRGPNSVGTDLLNDMAFDNAGNLHLAGSSVVTGQGANFLLIKVASGDGLMTPAITWNNPADITYGTALSSTQLNATANVPGSFYYAPAAGTVLSTGYQPLSVTFTPADTNAYRSTTKSVTLLVKSAPASITLGNLTHTYNGVAKAATVVTDPPNINFEVAYSQNGTLIATSYNGAPVGAPVKAGSYNVAVTINSSVYYGNATGVLVINKATPAVNWSTPQNISSGTALSGSQLNATASVPGTYQYSPAAGTVLGPGTHQLSVTFTPTDAVNYNGATKTVQLTVAPSATQPTTPTITWANPADITYGTALSDTQLNATASVPGTFQYTPPAGTVLGVGTHQLSVTFTPADTVNFKSVTQSAQLIVKAAAVDEGAPALHLVLDEAGPEPNQAAALDSLLSLRDPFPIVNGWSLFKRETDQNTRVIVFVSNLQLTPGETSSSVIVNLTDANQQSYDVAAEGVTLIPLLNFAQVVFRLPDNLAIGTCTIVVKAQGKFSNPGVMRIRN